jgi:hypothetical protein
MGEVDRLALDPGADGHERGALRAAQEVAAGAPALPGLAALLENGPSAVHGQGAVDLEPDVIQPFGSDALDRVPPDLGQAPGHLPCGFLRLKLERMLSNRSGVYPWRFMMMYCCAKVMRLFAIQ